MKKTLYTYYRFLFCIVLLVASSCAKDFEEPASPSGTSIAATLSADNGFNVLTSALNKTGLYNSLDNNNSGSFTLFAPSDAAFVAYFKAVYSKPDNFTEDSVISYIKNKVTATSTPLKTSDLASRLSYHLISSPILSTQITGSQGFTTMNSGRLSVSKQGSLIVLNANASSLTAAGNGATVTALDKTASNGVIHTIDKVLVPVTTTSLLVTLGLGVSYATNPATVTLPSTDINYNLLDAALKRTGLASVIFPNVSPTPDFTLFAPSDNAFKTYLGVGTEADGIVAINAMTVDQVKTLTDVLKYHIVAGRVLSTDLSDAQQVATLLTGKTFKISIAGSVITLQDNNSGNVDPVVTSANILTNAGIIHVIDNVLIPQ